MAANSDPVFSYVPHNDGAQFTSADTTALKTVYTGQLNGSRIDNIACSTNDTSAVDLGFYVQVGGAGTNRYLGNVHLAAGSGYTTVAGVNGITALPLQTLSLELASGDLLKVGCAATMTAAKTTDVVALGGDY